MGCPESLFLIFKIESMESLKVLERHGQQREEQQNPATPPGDGSPGAMQTLPSVQTEEA